MNNIEGIINRLKDEGLTKGKEEADAIIQEAHEKAKKIISKAHEDAQIIIEKTEKSLKEKETAANYALEFAAKGMLHTTAVKISEILEISLKNKISETISSSEVVQKIIKGEKVEISELLPLMREKIMLEGAEIEYIQGKINITAKDKNFHYEISTDTILESYKSYIREELYDLLFPSKL